MPDRSNVVEFAAYRLAPPAEHVACDACGGVWFRLVDGECAVGTLTGAVCLDAGSGHITAWSGLLECRQCGTRRLPDGLDG